MVVIYNERNNTKETPPSAKRILSKQDNGGTLRDEWSLCIKALEYSE